MSKKVLNYAGKRPMLLALIMATLTLGLLFSGWLTPISVKAQTGQSNPQPTDEATDCEQSSVTTNSCSEGTVTFSSVTVNPAIGCVGSAISASVPTPAITAGRVIVDTSYTNANPNATNTTCDDTYVTNTPLPEPDYTWTASGCGINTNGSGLSTPPLMPTSCGSGTVIFTAKWQNTCDTNQSSTSASGSFQVDAVTSLTPSAGLWVDDGDGDPNTETYLVQYGCYNTITVTAGDCLGLSAADLPSCWNMTGGTEIDRKNHSVDSYQVGKTVVNVTCGTSHKTVTIIVYRAGIEIDADKGNCLLTQHAWWDLKVEPSDVYVYLKKSDGTSLSGSPPLGIAGFYGDDSYSCGFGGCPAHLEYGPQPITGTSGFYSATGDYWWCISFGRLIGALTYVSDLAANPGTYQLPSNSCVTQALNVGNAAGVSTGFSSGDACYLSDWLNAMCFTSPPVCSCSN